MFFVRGQVYLLNVNMSNSVLVTNEKLNILNKQIIEIKKKIQLSEGQRKANFEECDAKRRECSERIGRSKREIKELQVEFAKAKNNDEVVARVAHLNRESSVYVKKRNLQEAKVTLDEDNIRLRKKLDLVKYQSSKQQNQLSSLLEEYENLMNGKPEKVGSIGPSKDSSKKKVIRLENQLHRMSVMQMEADTIRKKYRSIRSSLKVDASFYASCLDRLEQNIRNQKNEIKRLKKIKVEALELREITKEALIKQEIEALRTAKKREIVIQEYKKCVEDRKVDLERLERAMFPATRSATRDDLDPDRKSQSYESSNDALQNELDRLEEVFAKLRNATGVSKTEDVLDRFRTQQTTKEKLKKMQITTEEEKVILEKTRQLLNAEIEMQKFSETKDADQNAEKLEKLNKEIQNQCCRQKNFEEKFKSFQDLFKIVGQKILMFCDKIIEGNENIASEENSDVINPNDALQRLNDLINILIEKLGGPEKYKELTDAIVNDNTENASMENSVEQTKIISVDDQPLFPLFPMVTTPAAQPQPSEDEDDIPSRNLLKRQAQLLVDTKSRRKGFAMKR